MMIGWAASKGCATLFLVSHVAWWCVMSNLCSRRCTLGRSVVGMSVQSVVMEEGMPPCVRILRAELDGGSCKEKRKRRGVSVAVPEGLCDKSSAEGSGVDCVLAYTDVRALVICVWEKWGETRRDTS